MWSFSTTCDPALIQQLQQIKRCHVIEEIQNKLWHQLKEFYVCKLLEPNLFAIMRMIFFTQHVKNMFIFSFLLFELFSVITIMAEDIKFLLEFLTLFFQFSIWVPLICYRVLICLNVFLNISHNSFHFSENFFMFFLYILGFCLQTIKIHLCTLLIHLRILIIIGISLVRVLFGSCSVPFWSSLVPHLSRDRVLHSTVYMANVICNGIDKY